MVSLKGCSKTLKRFRPFVSERRIVHNVTERNDESSIGVGKPGERTIHSMHMHALPFPSVCVCVCVLADLNRQTGRPCFVRPLLRRVAFSRYRGCWCGSMWEWVTSFIGCIRERFLANRLVEHRSASSRQGNRLTRMFFTPSVESTILASLLSDIIFLNGRIYLFVSWFVQKLYDYIFLFDKLIDVIKKERKQKNKFDYFRVFLKCFIRLLICNYL